MFCVRVRVRVCVCASVCVCVCACTRTRVHARVRVVGRLLFADVIAGTTAARCHALLLVVSKSWDRRSSDRREERERRERRISRARFFVVA